MGWGEMPNVKRISRYLLQIIVIVVILGFFWGGGRGEREV